MRALQFILAVIIMIYSFSSIGWSACEGDLNCDGDVDGEDLAIFVADYGTTGCGTCDDVIVRIEELEDKVARLETLLQHFTRNDNDIYIDGANLHIRSGSGSTDGSINGLGNLIVGYNEEREGNNDRSGSHNIVVGVNNNYLSYGGLVAGKWNEISAEYASVSGGWKNTAGGENASVSGGYDNTASDFCSSVSGGSGNTASEYFTSVTGGEYNTADTRHASVSGGRKNTAGGTYSSVSGGKYNTAGGHYSSVSGGMNNQAIGDFSYIGGGGGTEPEDGNLAVGNYSAVLGGFNNLAGDGSTVWYIDAGRYVNFAGTDLTVGEQSVVSGGYVNRASGNKSSVSGGTWNTASAARATVSGGSWNVASGGYSSVSGGQSRTAPGANDWAAGSLFEEN